MALRFHARRKIPHRFFPPSKIRPARRRAIAALLNSRTTPSEGLTSHVTLSCHVPLLSAPKIDCVLFSWIARETEGLSTFGRILYIFPPWFYGNRSKNNCQIFCPMLELLHYLLLQYFTQVSNLNPLYRIIDHVDSSISFEWVKNPRNSVTCTNRSSHYNEIGRFLEV